MKNREEEYEKAIKTAGSLYEMVLDPAADRELIRLNCDVVRVHIGSLRAELAYDKERKKGKRD
jgi:hypothetical protein